MYSKIRCIHIRTTAYSCPVRAEKVESGHLATSTLQPHKNPKPLPQFKMADNGCNIFLFRFFYYSRSIILKDGRNSDRTCDVVVILANV